MSETESRKCHPQLCILHVLGTDHGYSISLRNIKTEMSESYKIHNQRLSEPPSSSNRMEAVCTLIAETLEGLDLDCTGYHRQCYQLFHANMYRLKGTEVSNEDSSSQIILPGKVKAAEIPHYFLQNACSAKRWKSKLMIKLKRPVKFVSWRHKESAWQQIEVQALALGKTHLFRQVQEKDFHAAQARCHS